MIYDKLSNIGIYKGISKNLDLAIDFILTHDLNELPLGKTILDGDNVYINVMDTSAAPIEERRYEIHYHYMDIQIDLKGIERVDTGDRTTVATETYDKETDVGTVNCDDLASCILGPGNFIICAAGEPHKPNIQVSENAALKKCVLKVHS